MEKMKWLAELGSNHNGNLLRACRLIEEAKKAGFDGIKTQQFSVRRMFRPEALKAKPELLEREKLEMPLEWHETLSGLAHELGMKYGCTPFYPGCIQYLSQHVDFFKISSYQILDKTLFASLCDEGKPIILSTGMATMVEVVSAIRHLRVWGPVDLTLLHCVSCYPTPPEECNLSAIETMRREFDLPVGWSDHTVCPAVIRAAVWRWSVAMCELHFDLDDGLGVEAKHSWTPKTFSGIKGWMHDWPSGKLANFDGTGHKIPQRCELEERKWRSDPFDGLRPLLEVP